MKQRYEHEIDFVSPYKYDDKITDPDKAKSVMANREAEGWELVNAQVYENYFWLFWKRPVEGT